MPFAATRMDPIMNGDCHTESSKSGRERQMYDIAYMWNLKKRVQMNLFVKQK